MSENTEETSQKAIDNENTCVVCFKPTTIFSIGACNHATCFECSARMRCLLLQNECPICRQDLPKVIFSKSIDTYVALDRNTRSGLFEKRYRIVFADLEIQKSFYHLLAHRCLKCEQEGNEEVTPFVDFHELKKHVRKVHEQFYCEICTENLKIFSSERRCYTRQQLGQHRRLGDPDDKSHRGHPRCDYCELRYLDKDELFRHLRREHYYCHLCDADGINLFYETVMEMRDHFKAEHFLCEEDECVEEELTAVFRTEIDLRAHKATVHSKTMSRTEARQARILEIDISYGPRSRGGGGGGGGERGGRIRTNDTQREFDINPDPQIIQQPPIQIDTKNEEHFPSLAGPSTSSSSSGVQLANSVRHIVYGQSGLARTKENFPALGSNKNQNTSKKQTNQNSNNNKQKQQSGPTASSLFKAAPQTKVTGGQPFAKSANKTPSTFVKDPALDFPSLPQNSGYAVKSQPYPPRPSSTSVSKSSIAPPKKDDYPSLPTNSSKKTREMLMEDLVLPNNSSIEKGLISSKHRNLVNDYVSVASQMGTKVNIVKQKDEAASVEKKSVPKLNSINNFPTLGASEGESGSRAPHWITVKSNGNNVSTNQKQPKVDAGNKKKQQNTEVPQKSKSNSKVQNGMKKANDENKKGKKENNASKENQSMLSLNQQPAMRAPPPGFKQIEPTAYRFVPVPDASKRNQALVEEFQQILKTNEQMQEFRLLSQMFRDGNYFARSYFESCKGVLGEKFNSIFPELLVLLPDIEKQQKLYRIYLEDLSESRDIDENITTKKNKKSQKTLEVCATCQQVLLAKDLHQHVRSHSLENNFPTISKTGESPVKSKN